MREPLSRESKAEARRIFSAAGTENSQICSFCGGFHHRACPRVSGFELYETKGQTSGGLKQVSFWPEGTWDDSYIVWPEDIGDDDDDQDSDADGGPSGRGND